jgi:malonyl-ACP decarboxylase
MNGDASRSPPVITGVGVISTIGQGRAAFEAALFNGEARFGYLQRPGRQGERSFVGAELAELKTDTTLEKHRRLLRTASLSAEFSLLASLEAWQDAGLHAGGVDPTRIGLVVGGSNLQERWLRQTRQRHGQQPRFISPTYGLAAWDSDLVGILSQALGIRGEGHTVGGASASGSMAILHAARQIQLGIADVSLAVGALFDLSVWECEGFVNMGAMGGQRYAGDPAAACRPFDRDAEGFIYGEGCGVVVLEAAEHARRRGKAAYGELLGGASVMDATRGAHPDPESEARVMRDALRMAGLSAHQIDYVNTHGTGAPIGDTTEVAALKSAGLSHCLLNATKSLTGHGLTAAGTIEVIATLLQMRAGRCHPTRNLINPIDPSLRWVTKAAAEAQIRYALSNSFAFGGLNTALVLHRPAG